LSPIAYSAVAWVKLPKTSVSRGLKPTPLVEEHYWGQSRAQTFSEGLVWDFGISTAREL